MNDLMLGKKWTDRGGLQPITMILIAHPDYPDYPDYPDHRNSRPISKNTNILQMIGIGLLFGHNEKSGASVVNHLQTKRIR